MPVFAFTAGSLGDILALIGVVRGLSSSLSEIYSHSGALRELVDDVALFTRAIDQIKKALDRRDGGMHEDVLRGIREHLRICRDILLVITGRITAFNSKLAGRAGLSLEALRTYWSVAAWEILGGREEVNRLRARLRDQIGAIQIYLALVQCQGQDAVEATARSQHARADRIIDVLQDMQRCFGRPAVPSFPFTDKNTGLPYAPCARASVQHIRHLFPVMRFLSPSEPLEPFTESLIKYHLNDGSLGAIRGFVGHSGCVPLREWLFSIHCHFYRGPFGCFEVFIGIPPREAQADTAAIQSLCRDIVMIGHIDLTRRGADLAQYRAVKSRGDYLNRLAKVYEDLCGEWRKVVPACFGTEDTLIRFLKTFPNPKFLETSVIPYMRYLSQIVSAFKLGLGCGLDPFDRLVMAGTPCPVDYRELRDRYLKALNIRFQRTLALQQSVEGEFQLSELWRLLEESPRLDPGIVAQYKLTENITAVVGEAHVTFRDASLDLVRAAERVPDFWDGL